MNAFFTPLTMSVVNVFRILYWFLGRFELVHLWLEKLHIWMSWCLNVENGGCFMHGSTFLWLLVNTLARLAMSLLH